MDDLSPLILFIYPLCYFHDSLSTFVCPHESVLSFLHNYSPPSIIKESAQLQLASQRSSQDLMGELPQNVQYMGVERLDSVYTVTRV
jgi:hypothetical protein